MTMPFTIRFLLISLIYALSVGAILLIQRLFCRHLTTAYRYRLWKLFLLTLAVPALPITPVLQALSVLRTGAKQTGQALSNPAIQRLNGSYSHSSFWMDDAILAVNKPSFVLANRILLLLWLAGMLVIFCMTLSANRPYFRVRRNAYPSCTALQQLLRECKDMLGHPFLRVQIYTAPSLTSPMADGLFHRRILLPKGIETILSKDELRHILLHELMHIRHWDVWWNNLAALFTILYWFHPAVWYACRQSRTERETACDASVLTILGSSQSISYGNTLLNFAQLQTSVHPALSLSTEIGSSSKSLKKRILSIASHQPITAKQHISGTLLLLLLLVFSLTTIPYLSIEANSQTSSAKGKHIVSEDYSREFNGLEGSLVWLSAKDQVYHVYHPSDSLTRRSPNSTYKIYSALLALESGNISEEESSRPWNQTRYALPTWNQNQTLDTAMANSVNWYFQQLDQQSGRQSISQFLSDIHYGNQDTRASLSTFWLESSLTISPMEQVDLLQNLFTNQFPNRTFRQSSIDAVKKSLRLSSSSTATLYGKTGSSIINNQYHNGWFIGYIEHPDNTYYFATTIRDQTQASGSLAATLTKQILTTEGIY